MSYLCDKKSDEPFYSVLDRSSDGLSFTRNVTLKRQSGRRESSCSRAFVKAQGRWAHSADVKAVRRSYHRMNYCSMQRMTWQLLCGKLTLWCKLKSLGANLHTKLYVIDLVPSFQKAKLTCKRTINGRTLDSIGKLRQPRQPSILLSFPYLQFTLFSEIRHLVSRKCILHSRLHNRLAFLSPHHIWSRLVASLPAHKANIPIIDILVTTIFRNTDCAHH